jgi:polysaccharide pyruvyl transferase WcaK-like protein/MoaA/NifB/PqqE/SkfB family radical SAM enzyme
MNLHSLTKVFRNFGLTATKKTNKSLSWKKPQLIEFFIEDIDDSKYKIDNFSVKSLDSDITTGELDKILRNSLFQEVSTIVINGGEAIFRKDLSALAQIVFNILPKIKTITLITNGLNSNRVIESINQIGQVVKNYSGKLDLLLSFDRLKEIDHTINLINHLQSNPLVTNKKLLCTVTQENIYQVEDLLEFAIDHNIDIKYRLAVPNQIRDSDSLIKELDLNLEEKYHFAVFLNYVIRYYEKSPLEKFFYQSLIEQIMYQKPRLVQCDCPQRGVILSIRGNNIEQKNLASEMEEKSACEQPYLNKIIVHQCGTCITDNCKLPPLNIVWKEYLRKLLKLQSLKKLSIIRPIKNIRFDQRIKKYGIKFSMLNYLTPCQVIKKPSMIRNYQVLVCGWYGTETLGDKAILGGVVESLRKSLGNIELHLVSLEKYISQVTISQMPELEGTKLYSISEVNNVIESMDLVVFGGGPLMVIDEMAEMLLIFQQAVIANIPTIIAGCGVGPLGNSSYNNCIASLLKLSSLRIYRDQKSLELANSLGVNTSRDFVAEDPALTWIDSKINLIEQKETSQQDQSPVLILGLRDWPYEQYAPWLTYQEGETIKSNFEREIVKTLQILCRQYSNLKIIPFPMCTNHLGSDDRWFYRKLFRFAPEIKNNLDLTYLGKEISPLEALQVYQHSTLALTMRFHALVFALGVNVPVIAIDYTLGKGKVKSLAEKYGCEAISLERLKADDLSKSLSSLLTNNISARKNNNILENLQFTTTVNQSLASMMI